MEKRDVFVISGTRTTKHHMSKMNLDTNLIPFTTKLTQNGHKCKKKKKRLKFTKKTKTQILNEKNPLIDTMLKEDIQMTDNYIHKARKCKLN